MKFEDNYVVYHLHDELSLLDSCTNFKLYVDKAKELNQKAICFSNHGNIYNHVEKKIYCEKIIQCKKCDYAKDKDRNYKECTECDKYESCILRKNIKYIHGVEIYLTKTFNEEIRDNFHTILISKNYSGYLELNNLISISTQDDHFYYKPRISFDEFLNISDNIIKISACMASPLNRLPEEDFYYEQLLNKYDYYEIQPHVNSEEQKEYNKKLYQLSLAYNKPLILGTDVHSLDKYKTECRYILQKAKKMAYENENEFDLTYKSYDELVEMCLNQNCLPMEVYLEAINNTNIMADSVETFELDLSFKYPKLYKNDEEVFKELIDKKYKYKLENGIIDDNPKYLENIKEEFTIFKKLGMLSFMLFFSELMTWCRENNIPFGNCRGSVGGSTIAYITDIIDLNPVRWNTIFSRFCNEDRLEIGDIDVDISPSQRDLVYEYIIKRFGQEYTAYILAITTISDKGTIDEIGRALNIISNGEKYKLPEVSRIKDEFDKDQQKAREKYPELFYYFDGLLNTAIAQSVHPAGIIASPVTLADNYGIIHSKDKVIMTINMEEVHEVSLVKYDILGLKNIEIVKDTCEFIGKKYPLSHEMDWEDEKVWDDMIKSSIGIFQFEGDYSFKLLKTYVPKKINDISLINASLRPSGASYRDRLVNREFNKNPSEEIDNLLKDNNGFLIFQEDTIKFLKDICGLTGNEADNIRRAIGRKDKDRLNKALPSILEGYCKVSKKDRETSEEEAKEFLQIIENSSDYQFGYNHSTGYSMIGYLCAYYRYYYPLEFATAYLNNAGNEQDVKDGNELCKLKGLNIKPIKFRFSKSKYFFNKETNSIYQGIASIKFLNEQVGLDLYSLKDKQYNNFTELLIDLEENYSINSRQMEILIKLNYFTEFGDNKKLLLLFEEFSSGKLKYDKKHTQKTKDKRVPLLIEFEKSLPNKKLSIKEQVETEMELLGFVQTVYPELKGMVFVTDLDVKYSPKLNIYGLATGVTSVCKINKKIFNKNPLEKGNIIKIVEYKKKPAQKMVDGVWKITEGEFNWWLEKYEKL